MEQVLYLSLVTATVSFTVTEMKLFAAVREWAKARSALLGELLCCGYCFGHWVAFAVTAIYRPRLFVCWWPLDYLLTALVIAWLSGFQWVAMCWLMERAGK